jgi:hypothetical protein
MSRIMNLFSRPAESTPPANPPANQPNPADNKNLGGGKNPTAGEQPNSPGMEKGGASEANSSPLDPFKDLWHPNKDASGEGKTADGGTKTPPAGTNFADIAGKLDFSRSLNPELVTKALSGDSASFSQIINQVARSAFATSAKTSEQLIAKVRKEIVEEISGSLPGKFKEFSLQDRSFKNPALKHPAVAPMLEAIKAQIAVKHPDATTDELTNMAEEYVSAAVKAMGSDPSKGNSNGGSDSATREEIATSQGEGTYDWNKHFGL